MFLAGIQVKPMQRNGLILKAVDYSFLYMPPVIPFHEPCKQVALQFFSGGKNQQSASEYLKVGALTTKIKELNQSTVEAT